MSIQKFDQSTDIEVFSVQTAPQSEFVVSDSGAVSSVTATNYVYPRRSESFKELGEGSTAETSGSFNPTGASFVETLLEEARLSLTGPTPDTAKFTNLTREYLNKVNQQGTSNRLFQTKSVHRSTPGVNLGGDMSRKLTVANVLMSRYAAEDPCYKFAYTNYPCLNFFSGSGLGNSNISSALIYPMSSAAGAVGTVVTASYIPTGAFTFDCWLKPCYTTPTSVNNGGTFKAGTVLHISGTFALSVITGSSLDNQAKPDTFRLLLQLSSSANTKPSAIDPDNITEPFAWATPESSLSRNHWHHITVRWGTETVNAGTGSILVDGQSVKRFVVPSGSIAARKQSPSVALPDCLTVGNFMESTNAGSSLTSYWFSDAAQLRYGVPVSGSSFISDNVVDQPASFRLNHQLQAEVHELKLFKRYLRDTEVATVASTGCDPETDPTLAFYVPPLFTPVSPVRTVDPLATPTNPGGVMIHPFQSVTGTTDTPFNAALSFDTGGHYINLENHTKDFATGQYPRLVSLTGSSLGNNTTEQKTCNEFLYASGSNIKGSLLVLPCDNGLFTKPSWYSLLKSSQVPWAPGSEYNPFRPTDHNSEPDYNTTASLANWGSVSLRNMWPYDSVYDLIPPSEGSATLNTETLSTGSIHAALSGYDITGSAYGTMSPQRSPTILQRTQDPGSLQVVMFEVSSLMYGNRIRPKSVVIEDTSMTPGNVFYSTSPVKMKLVDDGNGNLYRANAETGHATWSSVGNVFYDHGVILLKNPALYFFGQSGYTLSFMGDRNIHVLKLSMVADSLSLVSSSNPGWRDSQPNYDLDRFVCISDIYIHDDNLNVIAKTKLTQPVLKRATDKFKFVAKIDY